MSARSLSWWWWRRWWLSLFLSLLRLYRSVPDQQHHVVVAAAAASYAKATATATATARKATSRKATLPITTKATTIAIGTDAWGAYYQSRSKRKRFDLQHKMLVMAFTSSIRTATRRRRNCRTTIPARNMTKQSSSSSGSSRVLHHGSNQNQREIWTTDPLFGRLPKCGRTYLERHGWNIQSSSSSSSLSSTPASSSSSVFRFEFIWPNKSYGPQPSLDSKVSRIRPYPTSMTAFLDDKKQLAELLQDTNLMPQHITCIDELEATQRFGKFDDQSHDNSHDNHRKTDRAELYFVKHRYGAQGKSVYVKDRDELVDWWHRTVCTNRQDFVIQKEIAPPALDHHGHKFVLRSHVLFYQQIGLLNKNDPATITTNDNEDTNNEGQIVGPQASHVKAFLHNHIVCLSHASPYVASSQAMKSAHISQAGGGSSMKKCNNRSQLLEHLLPRILEELDDNHPAKFAFEPIYESCRIMLEKASTRLQSEVSSSLLTTSVCLSTSDLYGNDDDDDHHHGDVDQDDDDDNNNNRDNVVTLFALAGLDHLMTTAAVEATKDDNKANNKNNSHRVKLCEINIHPALGWGSMKHVNYNQVYQPLIEEMLSMIILDCPWNGTNFIPII